ncbi:uncharacterized protein TRIADDRAFT_53906 [Trichoplax adhaerens]|uniref:Uncharacterized protein n=1 Tax=Trichoplax adhaerens TaxID=10228 RepID=B3RMD1_TRIAD|nr:hypothetical protein TRIADDRAFT_53906 [Trichoplax adhaerens]EDV27830.1 hypothetical protein TRIADDRAFT_53906 [Trichoplax adhaerens]|eukprot:XP_002109664.1 hypothetical protein TRIADDRAFT_53906 [Trichoplax adhaerens]
MATQGYGDELQYFNSSYTSKSFNMTHATTTIVYHGVARSRLVFYGISIAIGISIGSVLAFAISFHYCSKLLPQKSVTNIIAIGGILIMTYFVDYRPFNYASFLIANKEAIAIYVVISGGLTFCLCHTYEPGPEDPKRKVIQWIIQAIAILLMYYGLQLQEISFLVIIVCWIWSWQYHATKATAVVKATFKKFRKRYALRATVNTPHRFLTQEEFVTEGKVETEKALQQLRDYCTSPECNTWEIVKKLKDPKRFAELLYGNGDLDDRELYRWMNDSMFDVE